MMFRLRLSFLLLVLITGCGWIRTVRLPPPFSDANAPPPPPWIEVPSSSDRQIKQQILNELQQSPEVYSPDIHVEVEQGRVTLTGRVPTLLARDRAVELAMGTPGVVAVSPHILLDAPALSDATLREQIRLALAAAVGPAHQDIMMGVQDGLVTMRGTAPSLVVAREAANAVKDVRGVREVRNQVAVVLGGAPDEAVQRDVMQRLDELGMDPTLVAVDVDGGVVRLTGVVWTWAMKEAAGQAARAVAGVVAVDTAGLVVTPGSEGSVVLRSPVVARDAALKEEVVERFLENPRVPAHHLDVQVQHGVVVLRGAVPDIATKVEAGLTAGHVEGVVSVENSIRVVPPPAHGAAGDVPPR